MGKDTMWKNRQFGWLFSALGGLSRSRAAPPIARRWRAASPCSRAVSLSCCSPRASASPVRSCIPLFDGAVYVAIKAGVPIVPVGIGGSEQVMPKKAKFVYPRKVHIEIGPPIPPPKAPPGGRLARHVYKEHIRSLHAELQRLFDQAMQHVPWDYPTDTEYRIDPRSDQRVAGAGDESTSRPGPGSRSIRRSMRATASLAGLVTEQVRDQVAHLGSRHHARADRRPQPRSANRVSRCAAGEPSSRACGLRGVEVDVAALLLHDPPQQRREHRVLQRWASRP